jgi:hypothetical protein
MPNIQYSVGGVIGAAVGIAIALGLVNSGAIEAWQMCASSDDGLFFAERPPDSLQYCGYPLSSVIAAGALPITFFSVLGVGVQWLLQRSEPGS